MPMTETYRPKEIAGFVGLEKPKRIFSKFLQKPEGSVWLAFGNSGTGKTAFGMALAKELGVGELSFHHIASQSCSVDTIRETVRNCWMRPMSGRFHFVLVDEIAEITWTQQTTWLSFLDATEMPPDTIFFFTCNQDGDGKSDAPPASLEPRFVSRCKPVKFSTYGMNGDARELLARIWSENAPADAPMPDLSRIMQNQANNVRGAINALEMELLCA